MTEKELKEALRDVPGADEAARAAAHAHWARLAKPLGGLGALETLVEDAAALTGRETPDVSRRAALVLCADNGVVAQGVSQTDQSVTRAVAANLAAGRTSVCRMAAAARCDVVPVDIGMAGEKVEGVLDRRIADGTADFTQGPAMTREQALSRHQFKKVYLMIGINEMGTGTPESFFEAYARAVYKIRELQPDAIIFVQGIMRVAGQKNASDPVFNNTNINIRNVEIETLANGKDIFYIDVNEAVCDENGNLYADWTFDQIHLKAKYYQVWENFLMEHGIVKK